MTKHNVHYCPCCGSPSHPQSGCVYSETMVVCGRCTRSAWAWVAQHTKSYKRIGKTKEFVPFYTEPVAAE